MSTTLFIMSILGTSKWSLLSILVFYTLLINNYADASSIDTGHDTRLTQWEFKYTTLN